jgi:hypothetical protein
VIDIVFEAHHIGGNKMSTGGRGQAQQAGVKMAEIRPICG